MNVRLLLLWLMSCLPAHAQGFAGLGQEVGGFSRPQPAHAFSFPADHGAHSDYRIEWWYVTANLKDAEGQDYGVQWTLFRTALAPGERAGWSSPQLWMGHAALTTKDQHFVTERLARGGVGQAGVTPEPFLAWIDEWEMKAAPGKGKDAIGSLALNAAGPNFSYALSLVANKPVVFHGKNGYSVKSEKGQASLYYSQPFYEASGSIEIGGQRVPVTGKAWLDREWSSQPLASDQSGWDWFSLHLDSGEKLMAFRLRGAGSGFVSASWIDIRGAVTPLNASDLELVPVKTASVAGRTLPVVWRVKVPAKGLNIITSALNNEAWMDTTVPYWEGPIRLSGTHKGRGYLEMTGY